MTDGPGGPRTVIVVAKEPVAGSVKTRLCPPCTPVEAAALAEAALADTLEAVARANLDRRVLVLDGRPGGWLPAGFEIIPQRGGSFAERLDGAWFDAVGGRPGCTVQIGMDTPQVTSTVLEDALDRLAVVPSVIGPAPDGGWWALGLREHLPGLFHGVPMSAADTCTRQEARLAALVGTAPERLAFLQDVDHIADARAVATLAPGIRFARALAEIDR